MHWQVLIAFFLYFAILLVIALASQRKNTTNADFLLGGRSLNYYVTALSAHASDMSAWLLMGYPAVIATKGIFEAWAAIGLIIFMYLNWHFIAPKIRAATEKHNSLTLSSYFESRFNDHKGTLRLISAVMAAIFFTIYISAGLAGLGLLFGSLFDISYTSGIIIGIIIALIYPMIGGYVTLAWTDLFQGLFLLCMVLLVPAQLFMEHPHYTQALDAFSFKALLPDFSWATFSSAIFLAVGWGLGYFGQPHIITKFMGINNVDHMHKSKRIGILWLIITLAAATIIGAIGQLTLLPGQDPNLTFVNMVQGLYPQFLATFVLCAILAATISVMDAQILVLCSHITEDLYKKFFRQQAEHKELVLVTRLGILAASVLAFCIAYIQPASIYDLVHYAWTGLGCSFGPLIIMALFSKKTNKYGAIVGILFGGTVAIIWPVFNEMLRIDVPAMIPGFLISLGLIWGVSRMTRALCPVDSPS